jgi:hypothetical protein
VPRPPSRWDRLFDLKPVPIADHLVEELSRLLASELARWPLAVEEWTNPAEEARFRPVLAGPRPDARAFEAAFLLARLELQREIERIDDFMRNERWRAFVPPGAGYLSMLFLSRWLVEQLLAIAERTEGRLKRPQLVDLLARCERRLRLASPPA